ncbi:MAG: ATP-binding protein [Bacteroidales bacterium]|nr:ATP-binding protein [Bacteroidales bacterium]
MVLKIALLLSVIIQLGTAIIAVSMIKRTKFNASWILISVGFVLMSFSRFAELASLIWDKDYLVFTEVNVWIGVLVSVLMFFSLFFIRRIFNLQDIVDKVRTESENRTLSAVIKGEEKVRESIAIDLHDGIAPLLSSVKMILSSTDLDRMDNENRKAIERGDYVINEAITALKEISNQLSPHILSNYGLKRAVSTFLNQFAEYSNLKIIFDIRNGEKRYYPDLEISIYRIITELFNNTLKHSNAGSVTICIFEEKSSIILEYNDDGCGIDLADLSQYMSAGMGLENIRSRVKSLGGECKINSKIDNGFNVRITLPLNSAVSNAN